MQVNFPVLTFSPLSHEFCTWSRDARLPSATAPTLCCESLNTLPKHMTQKYKCRRFRQAERRMFHSHWFFVGPRESTSKGCESQLNRHTRYRPATTTRNTARVSKLCGSSQSDHFSLHSRLRLCCECTSSCAAARRPPPERQLDNLDHAMIGCTCRHPPL